MKPTLRILEFAKAWTVAENIVTGIFLLLTILFFFGYAIYSAAHHVNF